MQAARGPAVWRGADQDARDGVVPIAAEESDELVRAASAWVGRSLDELTPDEFAIPRILPKLATAAHTLRHGTGFVMFRGLPAERLSQELIEVIYWGIEQPHDPACAHRLRRSSGARAQTSPAAPVAHDVAMAADTGRDGVSRSRRSGRWRCSPRGEALDE